MPPAKAVEVPAALWEVWETTGAELLGVARETVPLPSGSWTRGESAGLLPEAHICLFIKLFIQLMFIDHLGTLCTPGTLMGLDTQLLGRSLHWRQLRVIRNGRYTCQFCLFVFYERTL